MTWVQSCATEPRQWAFLGAMKLRDTLYLQYRYNVQALPDWQEGKIIYCLSQDIGRLRIVNKKDRARNFYGLNTLLIVWNWGKRHSLICTCPMRLSTCARLQQCQVRNRNEDRHTWDIGVPRACRNSKVHGQINVQKTCLQIIIHQKTVVSNL
jgi:hypothetical protein